MSANVEISKSYQNRYNDKNKLYNTHFLKKLKCKMKNIVTKSYSLKCFQKMNKIKI